MTEENLGGSDNVAVTEVNSSTLLGTAHSSGVFISHTSRERSESELTLPGDTMNKHKARKRYMQYVLAGLTEGFAARQIDVWIDQREIDAGDDFEQAICLSLVRCSAAIVLIDRDALTSGYMREEARLLGWRKILEPDLLIVPVLLGGVTAAEFAKSPLGAAGGLSRLSHFLPDNRKQNQAAAALAARQICAQIELYPLAPKAARWVNDVAHFIAAAPAHALDEAAEVLGIFPDTLLAHKEKHALIAAALLNSSLQTAFQVMQTIAEYLSDRDLEAAKRRIVPLWVDLEDARVLMKVSDAPPRERIVHLIAGRLLPAAEHAVHRASASQRNVRTAKLGGVAGEDMVAELVDRYDVELRSKLNLEFDDSPDYINDLLLLKRSVVFALMNCDQVPYQVIRAVLLELMRRFPGVVFALVSSDPAVDPRQLRGQRIRLATDDTEDRRTLHLIREIQGLNSKPVGIDVD
ncbi:toll/interleukin-1 receptor domain-containing protein [Kribbella endophytica]